MSLCRRMPLSLPPPNRHRGVERRGFGAISGAASAGILIFSLGLVQAIGGEPRAICDCSQRTLPSSVYSRRLRCSDDGARKLRDVQFGDVVEPEVELFRPGLLVAPGEVGNDEQFHGARASHVEQPKVLVALFLVLSLQRALQRRRRHLAERPVQALVAPAVHKGFGRAGHRSPVDGNDDRPLKAFRTMDRHDLDGSAVRFDDALGEAGAGRPIVVQVPRELHEPAHSIVAGRARADHRR